MPGPENIHKYETHGPQETIDQRVLATFANLRQPLEELHRTNPVLARSVVDLYSRILEELIARATVSYGEGARLKHFSPQHTAALVNALAATKLDLPHFP